MKTPLPSLVSRTCTFSIGYMCDNYMKCEGCQEGSSGKSVTVRETVLMGKGLFADQNIKAGEYIVPYDGKKTDKKPKGRNNYIAEIKYPENAVVQKTCYVNAMKSRSIGKYVNHSCRNNAVLCKIPNKKIPRLWIKAKDDIEYNEEITIDYGNEKDRILEDCGGCKCTACVGVVQCVVAI